MTGEPEQAGPPKAAAEKEALGSLKELLGSATAAVSIISSLAFVLSVAYEQAYFTVIGGKFQSVASLTDYLTQALDWLPTVLAGFFLYVVAGFVMELVLGKTAREILRRYTGASSRVTENVPRGQGSDAPNAGADRALAETGHAAPKETKKKVPIWPQIASLLLFVAMFSLSYFTTDPAELWQLVIFGFFIWLGVIVIAEIRNEESRHPLPSAVFTAMLVGPSVIGIAFGLGLQAGYRDLGSSRETYGLIRKVSETQGKLEQVIVLRTLERGVLVRLPDQKINQLLRLDEIRSISLSRDGEGEKPLGCRHLGWFC